MAELPPHVDEQIRARFRDLYQQLSDTLTLSAIEIREEAKPKLDAMLAELREREGRSDA
ncbi:hypothetical protein SEA_BENTHERDUNTHAT_45 [Gordonia phage BENtherdunthat]|uniref:Uncharacterized protein n=1 Tax=Gordonia phage BENtherdunthat TaxID=2047830 RepID=A0A2H4PF19_9CAUD|nr:hypothetical protein HOS44_gp045 [Gordonia phage BENtherdunthat]ATW60815.1 hypothetical protein SEA_BENTHERDUNTHAT_45 [Gordonia phage BENtherdunthat]UAW08295.1 hypothetical protein SEA_WHITNEY_48 [Gordonia phage Whitney]WKW86324.1 hypothetical protein SEA_BUDSKI_45 [Gordonia phage Budski]